MIVVADAAPIHCLILLDHAELLHRIYDEVVVPDAVANELTSSSAPRAVRDWISGAPPGLSVVPVEAHQLHEVTDELDLGERAAIALAGVIHADLLLIDEAAGRAEARRRSLRVTGTLGVLRTAAERGLINVPDLIIRLKATRLLCGRGPAQVRLRSMARTITIGFAESVIAPWLSVPEPSSNTTVVKGVATPQSEIELVRQRMKRGAELDQKREH